MASRKPPKRVMLARVNETTPERLKAIAVQYGFVFGGDGSIGKLLNAIADGKLAIVDRKNFAEGLTSRKR